MQIKFMNSDNSKKKKKKKKKKNFLLILSERLGFRSSNKHVALQNLSLYYRWKNKRQQYKNNKLKMIASA